MDIKSLENLPNEIIIKNVLVHLSSKDVLSFGMTGNDRFKELAENVIKKRRKLEDMKKDLIMEFFNLRPNYKRSVSMLGKKHTQTSDEENDINAVCKKCKSNVSI